MSPKRRCIIDHETSKRINSPYIGDSKQAEKCQAYSKKRQCYAYHRIGHNIYPLDSSSNYCLVPILEDEVRSGTFFSTTNIIENISYNYSMTINNPSFNYWQLVMNTLIVGLMTTCFGLLVTILAAYAFARLKFNGRDFVFMIFLATMMIPGEMMVITNYQAMSNLELISANQTRIQAYLAMSLPFICSVFYIYLLRQTFKQIPNELYLAAKVDGKSDWTYLWKVMVPLASPTLLTIFILSLIGSWNAYVWPNLVVSNDSFTSISVALRSAALQKEVQDGIFETQYSWQMAATVLTVVPLLVLFIIFRKYIMRGVGRAGIKG